MVTKVVGSAHWPPALRHASVVVVVVVVVVVDVEVVVVLVVVVLVVVVLVVVVLVVDVVEVDDVVVEVVVVIADVGAAVVVSHEAAHTLLQHIIPVSQRPLLILSL